MKYKLSIFLDNGRWYVIDENFEYMDLVEHLQQLDWRHIHHIDIQAIKPIEPLVQ